MVKMINKKCYKYMKWSNILNKKMNIFFNKIKRILSSRIAIIIITIIVICSFNSTSIAAKKTRIIISNGIKKTVTTITPNKINTKNLNNTTTTKNKEDESFVKTAWRWLGLKDKMLFSGESNTISIEQKRENNYMAIGISGVLTLYWIILLLFYEREEAYDYENKDDIDTMRKYNPLLAGCIADNREVLPRDITAVILDMIRKDFITLNMNPNLEIDKEDYVYMVSINKKNTKKMDEIERYIINWFFNYYELEEIDLVKRLKQLSQSKDFPKKMEELNDIAEKNLHGIGANMPTVPMFLRIFNFVMLFFTIIASTIHIINNGVNVHIYQSTFLLFVIVVALILFVLPIIALAIHLLLILIVLLRKLVKSQAQKYSGKRLVETSAFAIIFIVFSIIIVYLIIPNKYVCLDIYMMGIAYLIVRTDNLMTRHTKEVLNDYYSLNEIKYRIQEYSLIKEKQINYIKLWDEYLIYAVAFGIPIPIVNKLKGTYKEDNDLVYLAKCESLYYICKAYLEVMCEISFKPKKQSPFGFLVDALWHL